MRELDLSVNSLYRVNGSFDFSFYYFGEKDEECINDSIREYIEQALENEGPTYKITKIDDESQIRKHELKYYAFTDDLDAAEMTLQQIVQAIKEQQEKEKIALELDEKQLKLNI